MAKGFCSGSHIKLWNSPKLPLVFALREQAMVFLEGEIPWWQMERDHGKSLLAETQIF